MQQYTRVLVTTWGHDPTSVFVSNLLLTVNDALTHSAVLIQVSIGCRVMVIESKNYIHMESLVWSMCLCMT